MAKSYNLGKKLSGHGGYTTSESDRLDEINQHRDTLLNRHVSLRLRLKLFDSVIMTCPLTSHQLQKLEHGEKPYE